MALSYATASEGAQEHTGSQVRIAATGPHAGRLLGLTDQTDLFSTLYEALGITSSTYHTVAARLSMPTQQPKQ